MRTPLEWIGFFSPTNDFLRPTTVVPVVLFRRKKKKRKKKKQKEQGTGSVFGSKRKGIPGRVFIGSHGYVSTGTSLVQEEKRELQTTLLALISLLVSNWFFSKFFF